MKEEYFLNHIKEGYTLIPLTLSLPINNLKPLSVFKNLSDKPNSYFFESLEGQKNWSRYTIIGLPTNEYIEVKDNKIYLYKNNEVIERNVSNDPIKWIEEFQKKFKALNVENLPHFQGGLVGYFGFDCVRFIEPKIKPTKQDDKINTPDIKLIISKEILIFDKLEEKIHIIIYAENTLEDFKKKNNRIKEVAEQLKISNQETNNEKRTQTSNSKISYHFNKSDFLLAVNKIKDYIVKGHVMQVVLSQRMSMPFDDNPLDFYSELRKINPSPYMYYLNLGSYSIIGSSPEILVRLENNNITVRPIAGTRPRGKTSSEDDVYERELIADPKENAEHLMLIDLGRNDIGKVAKIGTVKLTDKMIIEKYSHVMHMVSNVTAKLQNNLGMIDVLKATFPAGTVSGAPKIRAIEIIYELEKTKRGIYAGAIGYLGWNGNMDTAIAIRTCIIKNNELNIQCGAGIVNDSSPELEWNETINKGKAILQAYINMIGDEE